MRVIFVVSAGLCACLSLMAVDGSMAGPGLQDKDRNASLLHGVMPGTVATVYVQPSGLPAGAASWRTLKGHGLWCNSSWWSQYLLVRDNDARMLKASLGNTKYPSVIIYFPHYFADSTAWGSAPLQRLEESVQHFYSHGVDPIVFFGDPEFTGTATWQTTHDVVRNLTARSYLIDNIQRTLNVPGIANVTKVASLYWLGGSVRCNGHGTQPSCTEAMIAEYNSNLTQVMHQSGVSFWVHVDGPFWDGCWPEPCSHWNVAGYSPTDAVTYLEESDSLSMYQAVDAATVVNPHQAAHLIPKTYINFIYEFPDTFWQMAYCKFGINQQDVDTLVSQFDLNNANDHYGQSNFVAASMTFHKSAFDGEPGRQRSFGKKVGLRQEDPKKRPRISGGYGCGKPRVYLTCLTCDDDSAGPDPNFGNRYPVQVKIHFWDDQIKNHFELQSGTVQKVSQADDGQTIKTFYVHNKDIFVTALHFKAALNIYAYWMHLNIDIEQAVAQLREHHISD